MLVGAGRPVPNPLRDQRDVEDLPRSAQQPRPLRPTEVACIFYICPDFVCGDVIAAFCAGGTLWIAHWTPFPSISSNYIPLRHQTRASAL